MFLILCKLSRRDSGVVLVKKPYFAGTGDDLWAAGDLAGEVVGVTEATFEEFETKAGEDQAWSQNSILFG